MYESFKTRNMFSLKRAELIMSMQEIQYLNIYILESENKE